MIVNHETILELAFLKEVIDVDGNEFVCAVLLVVDKVKGGVAGTGDKALRVGGVGKDVINMAKECLVK